MFFRKVAPFLVAALVGSAHADPGRTQWIATSNRAYAAMPPTALTDGKIGSVSWSPDGEHLVIAERPITTSREELLRFDGSSPSLGSLELLGWDRRFHQVRHLWGTEDSSATIDNVAWFKGTSVALITVRWVVRDGPQGVQRPMYGVLNVDAATGKFHWVPGMEQLVARPFVSSSPTRPIAAAIFSDNPPAENEGQVSVISGLSSTLGREFTLYLDLVDGGDGRTVTFSGDLLRAVQPVVAANNFWTLDTTGVTHATRVAKQIQLPLVWNLDGSAWFLVDTDAKTKQPVLSRLTRGVLEPTAEQQFAEKRAESDLSVGSISATAKQGKSQVSHTNLWLHSQKEVDHGEMLLAADGEWPELSPTNGGVFYIDSGVAKVRELIPLTIDQQRAAREAPKPVALTAASGRVIRVSFAPSASKPPQP